jgi:hypothetical protein
MNRLETGELKSVQDQTSRRVSNPPVQEHAQQTLRQRLLVLQTMKPEAWKVGRRPKVSP